MARKPPVEMTGMLTPRERVWQSVRKFGMRQHFTALMVEDGCLPTVPFQTVNAYLLDLKKAGHLEQIGHATPDTPAGSRKHPPIYKLVKTAFEAPRVGLNGVETRQGLGVLAMWRCMKVLKSFDYRDLARAASHPTLIVAEQTAQKYVNALARAGYLAILRAPTRLLPGRYRLTRNTGHHAPAITRIKCVFDRNLGQFTWQQPEQEVCDGLN